MTINIRYLLGIALLFSFSVISAQVRTSYTFEKGWKFTREDNADFIQPDYNDIKWQSVVVPHDWAIYGPFGIDNDRQLTAIAQDGQKEAMEHAGRTGGLPFVGVGWYRLNFDAPSFVKGKKATLIFDGAMSHARVYINGQEAGYWPYGYNTFYLDVTPYLKEGTKNTLAVRLENETESSRWYPGAGLYRNVHLVVTEDAHIPTWGTQLTTPVVKDDYAKVNIKTTLVVPSGKQFDAYRIVTELKDKDGKVVTTDEKQGSRFDDNIFSQELVVSRPALWSPETPVLYQAVSKVYEGNILKDEYTTSFGIRTIEVIPNKGFFLNGKRTPFKGVCNHHDLGPLGGAVNDAAIRRQIRILKDMGCNAIRTSHNMPAPELIRACDEMGMMVMAESFDEWKAMKVKNGYRHVFDEWAVKDLTNLLRHYRNNPSVVMWCIGNEVPEQWDGNKGPKMSYFLQELCHREDPTRPVTCGMDQVSCVLKNGFAAMIDVPGFNYRAHRYLEAYELLPQNIVLGSETSSTVSSRGVYKFPVEKRGDAKYDDHQSSGYDLEHCAWSNVPDEDFALADDYDWTIGQFVWTGFDYLGEPSPYDTDAWPSHSSLFGIIDLASLPKDRYYLYRSLWNKNVNTLHVLPHWTWPGREGENTPVFVYTNYPTAELFVNGKSYGKQHKLTAEESKAIQGKDALALQRRYRLMWMDVPYEPGEVKVVAYDASGKIAEEKVVRTAGKPHHLEVVADRLQLTADGKDLAYITVRVVDKDGNLCPSDSRLVNFTVKGAGHYRAAANGDATSLDLFHLPKMPAFSGQLTAIVQTVEQAGEIVFEAKAKGVKSGKLTLYSSK